jgi:hypothetical protein
LDFNPRRSPAELRLPRQHQIRPCLLTTSASFQRTDPPFSLSHSLLISLPRRFRLFGHQRSSLATARQLYAFIDNSILSVVQFANNFHFFFYTFGAALTDASICIALADSGLSVGTAYVFSLLLVEEGIGSNAKCVFLLFLSFCVIHIIATLRLRVTSPSATTAV